MRYRDASSFKTALTAHLRKQHPDEDVGRLLKRAMMERFLVRIAEALPDRALLKGGYAMELRLERARATQDLDLAMRDLAADEVVDALRDAGELELDDHLAFRVQETAAVMPQAAPHGGSRLSVVPLLGGKPFQPFPLDVGVGDAMPGTPEVLRGGLDLSFAGLATLDMPSVPVEVHLAEKLHALSFRWKGDRINTRVKDLVDVMLLMNAGLPAANVLRHALTVTFERRGTHDIPARFELPLDSWAGEYLRLARNLNLERYAPTVLDADEHLHELLNRIVEDETRNDR